jgi:hypothetical protein
MSLREDPEFTAMIREPEADVEAQPARVHQMRAGGELPDVLPPKG